MPQWAGSCWYELRYLDPTNEKRFVDPEVEQYWMGPQAEGRRPRAPRRRRPVRRRRRARRAAPAVRPLLAQGAVRPRPPVVEGAVLPAVQPGLHPGRGVPGRARDLRRRHRCRRARRRLLLRRPARHPRVGQDGQEPEERRLPRRHLRGLRRRHVAAVRDGDGPARRLASVGDPRRRRHVPLPAAAVAQHRRRGHRRGARCSPPRPTTRRNGCCTARSPACATTWRRCASTPRSPS